MKLAWVASVLSVAALAEELTDTEIVLGTVTNLSVLRRSTE